MGNRRFHVTSTLVSVLLLLNCNEKLTDFDNEKYSVSGVVLEKTSIGELTISDVIVTLDSQVDTSDSLGQYRIDNASGGQNTISFFHPDFVRYDSVVNIKGNMEMFVVLTQLPLAG